MDIWLHTKILMYSMTNQILIQQRTDTGKRDLPGWRVELPESVEAWVLREIYEETGISDISNPQIMYLKSDYSQETQRYFVLLIYACRTNCDVRLSDEHQSFQWINKEDLFGVDMTDYLKTALNTIKDFL